MVAGTGCGDAHAGAPSDYPVFKGLATLYVLKIMPDGLAFVPRSAAEFPPRRYASHARQHQIHDRHDFIGKPVFDQRRRQRGTTPQNEVGAVVGLDTADALDDVGAKSVERDPFETFRTVRSDVFHRSIDAVRNRATRGFRPGCRPYIIGAKAEQQIEILPLRGNERVPAYGGSLRCGPIGVRKVTIFVRILDHAVKRDVFENSDRSHEEILTRRSEPPGR